MATVHLGRLRGPGGFIRNVAIKRLHAQYAKDSEFAAMFMHEAQLSARISHPNVLPTLDVVSRSDELYLVMDYVHGDSLARLLRSGPADPAIASGVMVQVLLGLNAAHEARNDDGSPLGIVHRDVSPQNILVDEHGVVRIVDFGIAKAVSSVGSTEAGKIKGKLAYLSPEQLNGTAQDRRVDVFAAGIVLFEMLTGQRLFGGGEQAAVIVRLMNWTAPEAAFDVLPDALRPIARRALAVRPEDRYASAREMAVALQTAVAPASAMTIAEWLAARAPETLAARAAIIAEMERTPIDDSRTSQVFDSLPPIPAAERTNLVTVNSVYLVKSRRARTLGVIALLACLLVLGVLALRPWARAPEAAAVANAGAQPGVVVQPIATPVVERSAPSSSIPIVEPEQLPSETKKAEPPRPKAVPAARRPRVDCKVPFTVDANGMKHFKPECFR